MSTWQIIGLVYIFGVVITANLFMLWLINDTPQAKNKGFTAISVALVWPVIALMFIVIWTGQILLSPSKFYMRNKK